MQLKYCYSDVTNVMHVTVIKDYILYLQFADGAEGSVDIAELVPFEGVFSSLKNPTFFSQITVNPDIGTICWANGADLSPALLYENIQTNQK